MNPLRQQIETANDSPLQAIDIEEWGCKVHIKLISGTDRDAHETMLVRREHEANGRGLDMVGLKADLVARCLCDDQGNRLYDPENPEDVAALNRHPASIIDRLYKLCEGKNVVTVEAVEELEKK